MIDNIVLSKKPTHPDNDCDIFIQSCVWDKNGISLTDQEIDDLPEWELDNEIERRRY